jgi:hypothetical protein
MPVKLAETAAAVRDEGTHVELIGLSKRPAVITARTTRTPAEVVELRGSFEGLERRRIADPN